MNPFLVESPLPHHLPDFAAVRLEHYDEAFEIGIAEQQQEIDAIATNPAEPTFANTVEALELSGAVLDRVGKVLFHLTSADTSPDLRQVEARWTPKLAAHANAIRTNAALFARLDAVHVQPDLDDEQRHVVDLIHRDFRRNGAGLDAEATARLAQITTELSELTTAFGNQLLDESNAAALHLTDEDELDGLDEGAKAAARDLAADRGVDGWLIALVLPTSQPALASLTNRDVRRRLHEAATSRGQGGCVELVPRIAALRAERAALLGHPHHAAYALEDQTAGRTDRVDELLDRLIGPALALAEQDAVELTALLREDLADSEARLQAWDWRFYAERLRVRNHDLDTGALSAYFELGQVLHDGVFAAATQLYGVTFSRRADLTGPHPDSEVYEVLDTDGTSLGLFVGDWFARPSKRGGAWMNNLVDQSGLSGYRPVVCNTTNIARPAAGEPALLTLDNVRTLFHEFGHALHGLFAASRCRRTSGTSVVRDFVEFPSQVNEMWLTDPDVVRRFARHHRTGEPLAAEIVTRLAEAESFNQGWHTTEMVAAVWLDQAWHRLGVEQAQSITDPVAFEAEALAVKGLAVDLVPPRYRTGYFNHIFAGGYAAGYYSYLWSEVLDADTVAWFEENADRPLRELGDHFRETLLSRGSIRPEMDSYRAFRGRDPEPAAMLRRRGLL